LFLIHSDWLECSAKYFAWKSKQINARMLNWVVYSKFVANSPTISPSGNTY